MVSLELSVLTLNVWGIPLVSKDRESRINAICAQLNECSYDIVSLQEVWSQADSIKLQNATSRKLPHAHYFHSGVVGAGLLVLSKYPIITTLFHAWSLNGYFHRIQHADWFGGKGVGLCRILVDTHVINFYNAHLHAEYNDENDDYKTHRVLQAFDTAQFIDATRGNAVLQILAGDLNTKPKDLSYKVLLYTSKMTDSCTTSSIRTSDCRRNSYTPKKALLKNAEGTRIDHIFVRPAEHIKVEVMNYDLAFPERVPGEKFSFSDHEAILAKLKISGKGLNSKQLSLLSENKETCTVNENIELEQSSNGLNKSTAWIEASAQRTEALQQATKLCEDSLEQLYTDRVLYIIFSAFLLVLLVLLIKFASPMGFQPIFIVIKFVIFGVMIYCLFMAFIWNCMERNGVLQGKNSIDKMLMYAQKYNYFY